MSSLFLLTKEKKKWPAGISTPSWLPATTFLLKESSRKSCHPFIIDGVTVGLVRPDFAKIILVWSKVFASDEKDPRRPIGFAPTLVTKEQRSETLAAVLAEWREKDLFECLRGWRNELYAVTTGPFNSPTVLTLERAAVGIFGFRSYGCHLNGYTRDPVTGEIKLWVGRRSPTKPTWPNCLDNFVSASPLSSSIPLSLSLCSFISSHHPSFFLGCWRASPWVRCSGKPVEGVRGRGRPTT